MLAAHDLGMTTQDYLYFALSYERTFADTAPFKRLDQYDDKAFAAYQRVYYVIIIMVFLLFHILQEIISFEFRIN